MILHLLFGEFQLAWVRLVWRGRRSGVGCELSLSLLSLPTPSSALPSLFGSKNLSNSLADLSLTSPPNHHILLSSTHPAFQACSLSLSSLAQSPPLPPSPTVNSQVQQSTLVASLRRPISPGHRTTALSSGPPLIPLHRRRCSVESRACVRPGCWVRSSRLDW